MPDRLIPPGNRQYDVMKDLDRSPMNFYIGEFDIDGHDEDTVLEDTTSKGYAWWQDFLRGTSNGWAGSGPVNGQPAAHKLIDYVRVWDVPEGTPIPNFPH